MSLSPPVQCLFCNHLNPAGASFCNDCGSQMHLQPCDHCGAIDKRTAKQCYKCGAEFTRPPVPEQEPEPAPARELETAPTLLADPPDDPDLNTFAIAATHTPVPESVAQPVAGPASSPRWLTAMKSSRILRIAAVALLLAAIVKSGDYYAEQSAELTKPPGTIPPAPNVPATPVPKAAPATNEAAVARPPVPAPSTECPSPVAALGLCNPTTNQEGK